ncbi:MAG: helix-turn-helix domain-containing protein [Lachnospiraceae bacterium]
MPHIGKYVKIWKNSIKKGVSLMTSTNKPNNDTQDDARMAGDAEELNSRAKRFALMFSKSRTKMKKSQEFMALGLGVSKKTVQNWEKGTSSPTFFQSSEWFRILGLNPLPYYLEFVFPNQYKNVENMTEEQVNDFYNKQLSLLPVEMKRQILYILCGAHGSSAYSIIQLILAHLQTPLKDRVSHAAVIFQDYEMERKLGNVTDENAPQPDLDLLTKAIAMGKESVMSGRNEYSMTNKTE